MVIGRQDDVPFTAAAYVLFLDAIAAATTARELETVRSEIRVLNAEDERVRYLERLINARAIQLMDQAVRDDR